VNLDVYPNPNKGSFVVEGDFTVKGYFEVIDVMGQPVLIESNINSERAQVTLSESASGVYLVRWITDTSVGTTRISVTK
jgi:hypothetical protein